MKKYRIGYYDGKVEIIEAADGMEAFRYAAAHFTRGGFSIKEVKEEKEDER